MPVYRYNKEVQVSDSDDIRLTISFPDIGTAAHHIIDLPSNVDKEAVNEYDDVIGKGSYLKTERTVIYSKAVNMNPDTDKIRVNYYINGQLVAVHENLKNVDQSPQIKVTLIFV